MASATMTRRRVLHALNSRPETAFTTVREEVDSVLFGGDDDDAISFEPVKTDVDDGEKTGEYVIEPIPAADIVATDPSEPAKDDGAVIDPDEEFDDDDFDDDDFDDEDNEDDDDLEDDE